MAVVPPPVAVDELVIVVGGGSWDGQILPSGQRIGQPPAELVQMSVTATDAVPSGVRVLVAPVGVMIEVLRCWDCRIW